MIDWLIGILFPLFIFALCASALAFSILLVWGIIKAIFTIHIWLPKWFFEGFVEPSKEIKKQIEDLRD